MKIQLVHVANGLHCKFNSRKENVMQARISAPKKLKKPANIAAAITHDQS